MARLEARLAATAAFVTGGAFTLADIVIGLSAHRWRATPMERPHLPAVATYLARLTAETRFSEFARPDTP